MLSILIPIYNYDVVDLAVTLSNQCRDAKIEYEIVCYDDFSSSSFKDKNRDLDKEFGVSYIELSENKGRSKIRNMLARNARYEKLLFIDCDSRVNEDSFISNYLKVMDEAPVIYGGRVYSNDAPAEAERYLHWKYGSQRESLSLTKRKERPYRSFQTNNFIISRTLMMKYPFDETIKTYGYEDLLIAETLKNEGITILHINNPLIHEGVELTEDFLRKSELAAENLAVLYHSGLIYDTKMLVIHEKLKKIGFNSFLHNYVKSRKNKVLANLRSKRPRLFYFDLYRYLYFIEKLNSLSTSSS